MANMTSPSKLQHEDHRASDIPTVQVDPETGYFNNIDEIREREYSSLQDTTYLDHAGTTPFPKSLIEVYSKDLTGILLGNPHSASASSQLSSRRIDDTRLQVLRFFHASPEDFDVVFVASATAGIKLVADAFRDHESGFWYGYHVDSHTSLVGVRELATRGTQCFRDNNSVESWMCEVGESVENDLRLFAYPGQSNMTGHRPPLRWCKDLRRKRVYTLYDAAALLSTSSLDLSDTSTAPDFTVCSFYKIFGFPDLGALIVRKESGDVLRARKYFGGGTVDMVMTLGDQDWHAKKTSSLHDHLEDGTLPFHNIIALQSALRIHSQMYGSLRNVSRHCQFLASRLHSSVVALRHANGRQVVRIYESLPKSLQSQIQGPIIAFNLLDHCGEYVPKSEVEKLAIVKNIQLRTGGLCNPGGIAKHLDLTPEEMRHNFASGQRCGDDNDLFDGKPTGAIRVSLGAMSNLSDVERFIEFLREFYVDRTNAAVSTSALLGLTSPPSSLQSVAPTRQTIEPGQPSFIIESLSVYPIKSCAAFQIPPDTRWGVGPRGLAWDREWCLVHQGTGAALSQKKYPRMALLKPRIDVQRRVLSVHFDFDGESKKELVVALDTIFVSPAMGKRQEAFESLGANVCGSCVDVQTYTSLDVSNFFTDALGVPCTLARFTSHRAASNSKPSIPGAYPAQASLARPTMLANESPILLVSRSSVNRLNEEIKLHSRRGKGPHGGSDGVGKAVPADTFRGNIVVAEVLVGGQTENAYVEDGWRKLCIAPARSAALDSDTTAGVAFEVLGPCQRCQMVCVDQSSAKRTQEPFSTLAKTRRREGRVWFGVHLCLVGDGDGEMKSLAVGDCVYGTAAA